MGAKRDLKTLCCRLVLVLCYCILGAGIFYAIEHTDEYNKEVKRKKILDNVTKIDIMQRFGINETEYESLVSKIKDAKSDTPLDWSFSRGMDLCWQTMTTIGYGNKTPTTVGGQLFLIPFALFGIPLTVFMLNTIGENICHLVSFLIKKFEKKVLKREEVKNQELKSLISVIAFTVALLVFMAAISMEVEDWSFARGMYVWFVTFTTVGFGDYIPGSNSDSKSGIEVVLYRFFCVLLGLSLISTIFNAIGEFLNKERSPPTVRLLFCKLFFGNSGSGVDETRASNAVEMSEKSGNVVNN